MKRCGSVSQIVAILERSGLALVAVDRHQPRTGLAQHGAPLSSRAESPRRQARAANASSSAFSSSSLRQRAGAQPLEQLIAAARDIGVVADIVGQMRRGCRRPWPPPARWQRWRDRQSDDRPRPPARCRSGRRRARAPRECAGPAPLLQLLQQLFAAQHRAGQGVADPDGQRRDVRRALLHRVEMGVERVRGLEHLGEGKPHLVGQRGQVRGGDISAVAVLDEMQSARSGGRGAAAGHRAKRRSPRPPADRPGVPSAWPWPAGVPSPGCSNALDLLHIMTHRDRLVFHTRSSNLAVYATSLVLGMPDAKQNYGGLKNV